MLGSAPGGIICPVATPITEDEQLDVASLQRLLDYIVPHLDGLLVLGSTGEFAFLEDTVAEQAIEAVVGHINGRIPVFAGVGDAGTRRIVRRAMHAAQAGADYLLVTTPYYYGVQDEEALVRHFLTVAESTPVPILIYNIPQNTHVNLSPSVIRRLATHPNIVGLKDSWGDMIQFQEYLALRDEQFSVIQGREQLVAASFWLGADGIVSALANIAPQLLRNLMVTVQAGEREKALQQQRAITEAARLFDQGFWISALKVVLADLGLVDERVSQPLPSCSKAQKSQIRDILKRTGLLEGEKSMQTTRYDRGT